MTNEQQPTKQFEWTDELVNELVKCLPNYDTASYLQLVHQFKQSKSSVLGDRDWESDKEFHHAMGVLMLNGLGDIANKICKAKAMKKYSHLFDKPTPSIKERIEVLGFYLSSPPHKENVYVLHLSKMLNENDHPKIEKQIEAALNEDTVVEDNPVNKTYWAVQKNTLDLLECHHPLGSPCGWATFKTKGEAEQYIAENKGNSPLPRVPENKSSTEQPKEDKPILFTTEDGVGIKKGDAYSWVDTDIWTDGWSIASEPIINKYYFNNHKAFANPEAAEQYILEHKPCLSYKEAAGFIPPMFDGAYERMKEFVKEKLKQ